MSTIHARMPAGELRAAWAQYLETNPGSRIRDVADALGVSELELLATRCGAGATRLSGDWPALVGELHRLGTVMALTRNPSAVHEKHGVYNNASATGSMGLVLDEAIDLRIFYSRWHHGFAVEDEVKGGHRYSFHFFDRDGTAVHKVYLGDASDHTVYSELVDRFRSADQSAEQAVTTIEPATAETPDAEIDVDGFKAAWLALEDTHDFFGLLRSYGVRRTQAMRLAPEGHAHRVETSAMRACLEAVSADETPIMIFVGSPGVIQIHTGPVSRIKPMGPWINVLDPDFNLHLREDHIGEAWIVRKPTVDGVVTSLELFDTAGDTIALVFGKRKPGIPESEGWREHVAALTPLGAHE